MLLLELFSGTGSVGRVAKNFGYTVISLDLKNADICSDILEWDYTEYPTGMFHFIWASPPCTEYSRAKTTGVRKIEEANKIVKKTIEIINYFNPKYFVIENPQTGLLKNQDFMKDFDYKDVDYCKYGFKYRKRTRLWGNVYWKQPEGSLQQGSKPCWKPRPLCCKDCGNIVDGKHVETAQRLPSGKRSEWKENYVKHKQEDLYKIPEDLIKEILKDLV